MMERSTHSLAPSLDHLGNPEFEVDPRAIAVVTTTFYRNWYPGEFDESRHSVDKLRGDLAIQTIQEASEKGHQVVVVDGGSSEDFKAALGERGIDVRPEIKRGMSPSRQQGFKEASQLEGVKAIVWTEPEKVSIVADGCLARAVLPILRDEADIVIPKREEALFRQAYPPYQFEFENRANRRWNAVLRSEGLLSRDDGNLDVWFGPRVFRNDPEILNLLLKEYRFEKREGIKIDEIARPDLWPNATFLPVAAAFHQGLRVASVEVPYRHPAQQTEQETVQSEELRGKFERKREVQLRGIVTSTIHYLRLLKQDPRTRLRRVT